MVYAYQARALPKRGTEAMVEEAMEGFAKWVTTQSGLLHIHQLKDRVTGELVGLSFWKSKEDCDRMWAAAARAPDAELKNRALATSLQKPMETQEYEVGWESTAT